VKDIDFAILRVFFITVMINLLSFFSSVYKNMFFSLLKLIVLRENLRLMQEELKN